jgi:phage shock protein E
MKWFALCSLLLSLANLPVLADTIWIDVRSTAEFQQGHLPGAINIPHTDIANRIQQVTRDKNTEIQLYCRSGRRSGLAEAELKKLGYLHVVNAGAYQQLLAASQALSTQPVQQ